MLYLYSTTVYCIIIISQALSLRTELRRKLKSNKWLQESHQLSTIYCSTYRIYDQVEYDLNRSFFAPYWIVKSITAPYHNCTLRRRPDLNNTVCKCMQQFCHFLQSNRASSLDHN